MLVGKITEYIRTDYYIELKMSLSSYSLGHYIAP